MPLKLHAQVMLVALLALTTSSITAAGADFDISAIDFTWSPSTPEIGELVEFDITGAPGTIEVAQWNFSEDGCTGFPQAVVCTPLFVSCNKQAHKFASAGAKMVSVVVTVSGQVYPAVARTVTVASSGSCSGDSCTYSLGPSIATFPSTGGAGAAYMSTQPGCQWAAVSANRWVTLTGGSSGSGNGEIGYSVEPFPSGTTRSTTITAGGDTHVVRQNGPLCDATLSAYSVWFPAAGGSGSVEVTIDPGCQWTAVEYADWITIISGASGEGNGTVVFSVAPNPWTWSRAEYIEIDGTSLSVFQAAASAPDFAVTGSDSPDPAEAGQAIRYTFAVANVGGSSSDSSVGLSLHLPVGVPAALADYVNGDPAAIAAVAALQSSLELSPGLIDTGTTVSWSAGDFCDALSMDIEGLLLPAASSGNVAVTVTAPATVAAGTVRITSADVEADLSFGQGGCNTDADPPCADIPCLGPRLSTLEPISAAVELVDDGSGANGHLGCQPLVGFSPGHIALVDRGTCTFETKIVNAVAAGASAVVVADNDNFTDATVNPDDVLSMACTDLCSISAVPVPVAFVSWSSSQAIHAELAAGVMATIGRQDPPTEAIEVGALIGEDTPSPHDTYHDNDTWTESTRILTGVQWSEWERVAIAGAGTSDNTSASAMAEFDGYLYVATENESGGLAVVRSADGRLWHPVAFGGLGDPDIVAATALMVFDGALYLTTTNEATGGQVWRSPDGTSWTKASPDGFLDVGNRSALSMAGFAGDLYVGTSNESSGGQVWRTPDAAQWSQVNTSGFGSSTNQTVTALAGFNSQVYAGSTGFWGFRLFRRTSGLSWSQIGVDGFGDNTNTEVTTLVDLGGELVLGTRNELTGGEVWSSTTGSSWSQINEDGFGAFPNQAVSFLTLYDTFLVAGAANPQSGGAVWAYDDLGGWYQASEAGFGDQYNVDLPSAAELNGTLYVGTENPFGFQIWRHVPGLLFADGFEGGSSGEWSAVAP